MKTYKQFISETKQLDESKVKLAKIAFKGLKNIGKKLFKKAPKVPPRSIDPYFANLAVQRGTMIRGFHGQSARNIAKYKKIGIPPAKSGLKIDPLVQYKDNPATLAWIKKTGYQGSKTGQNMAVPGVDAYFATKKSTAQNYAVRGAQHHNLKFKNMLNPLEKVKGKDKGDILDVVVNKRSVKDSWKGNTPADKVKYASEKIAKAKDIIPVVPGPSSKVGKYRLIRQLRRDRLNKPK